MPTPHDHLVKSILGEPRYAAQVFQRYLPPEALRWLDLEPIARVDRSFIDEALSERHADLLFSVARRDDPAGESLVYLLFEHQSTPDPLMPFRLLSYMLRVWERWLADHPGAKRLPLIYPLVLYHGAGAWRAPVELSELIDLPAEARAELAQALPHLRHHLLDLSTVPEEALTDGALVALTLLLLKRSRSGDLVAHLGRWAATWRRAAEEGGLRAVEVVARYIVLVNTRSDTLPRLGELAGEVLGAPGEEVVMTAGERLIEQGRVEGMRRGEAKGRQEGRQEGRQAEAARILLRMLELKFGDVSAPAEARLRAAPVEALEAWTERIFTAESVEAVLA